MYLEAAQATGSRFLFPDPNFQPAPGAAGTLAQPPRRTRAGWAARTTLPAAGWARLRCGLCPAEAALASRGPSRWVLPAQHVPPGRSHPGREGKGGGAAAEGKEGGRAGRGARPPPPRGAAPAAGGAPRGRRSPRGRGGARGGRGARGAPPRPPLRARGGPGRAFGLERGRGRAPPACQPCSGGWRRSEAP